MVFPPEGEEPLPGSLDVQGMTDPIAKHGTAYADCNRMDPVVRVSRLHVGFIYHVISIDIKHKLTRIESHLKRTILQNTRTVPPPKLEG